MPAGFGEGLYDGPHTEATYAELLRRAEALLARGESVVLDASWSDARHRRAAERLAEHARSKLILLVGQAAAEARRLATGAASDATATIAEAMAQTADPWPEAVTVPTQGRSPSRWAAQAPCGATRPTPERAYPHRSALPPIRDVSPPGFGPGATADGPTSRRR